eukprot:265315-Prorocentrum_minimum.AAC.1
MRRRNALEGRHRSRRCRCRLCMAQRKRGRLITFCNQETTRSRKTKLRFQYQNLCARTEVSLGKRLRKPSGIYSRNLDYGQRPIIPQNTAGGHMT